MSCVSGLKRDFRGKKKKDRTDFVEAAPQDRTVGRTGDGIPADRTCAQCRGEIDGTERLVSVSGQAVWLHAVCEQFWVRAL